MISEIIKSLASIFIIIFLWGFLWGVMDWLTEGEPNNLQKIQSIINHSYSNLGNKED
jgi:hypothetical protein